jgi:hypothetical protein
VGRCSFPAGNEHTLIEPGGIDGLADSAKRLKPLLAALALIEEVLYRGFDEPIHIPVLAAGQLILDPIFDLRGQVHVHCRSSCFDFMTNGDGSGVIHTRSRRALPRSPSGVNFRVADLTGQSLPISLACRVSAFPM